MKKRTGTPEPVFALGAIAACTLLSFPLRPYVAAANLVMIYLLGVVVTAMRCSRTVAIAASFISVAAFDFFCVPPYYTFRVHDYEYLLTFAVMLVVALVITTQTARIREQVADSSVREGRSHTLYNLSRRLAGQHRVFEMARIAADYAAEVAQCPAVIFLAEDGRISFTRRSSDLLPVPREEEPVAQWAWEHAEKAGQGTRRHPEASALYLPLKGVRSVVGVLAISGQWEHGPEGENEALLDALASQTATTIENAQSQSAAETARMQAQSEQMRSSLLSAVSHDLRTPLASITGAATTLRAQGDKLAPETRDELLESIADEAERMGRLVRNLLDMTRLETGIELRRELCPVEEIAGAALQRLEKQLARRQVITQLPETLPPVYVDDVLLGQVLVNLLENAAKYTPADSPLELEAAVDDGWMTIEVRDRGPGFQHDEQYRIFEKFYRGRSEGTRGAGLGLAICRAIVTAHRGTIEALNRPGGGAIFRVRLPLESS